MLLAQVDTPTTLYAPLTTSEAAGLGIFVIVLIAISLAFLVFAIFVLLDILKQPDAAWTASGQNKQLWIILWVVGLCTNFLIIICLIYWFAIRPKVKAAAGGMPPG